MPRGEGGDAPDGHRNIVKPVFVVSKIPMIAFPPPNVGLLSLIRETVVLPCGERLLPSIARRVFVGGLDRGLPFNSSLNFGSIGGREGRRELSPSDAGGRPRTVEETS